LVVYIFPALQSAVDLCYQFNKPRFGFGALSIDLLRTHPFQKLNPAIKENCHVIMCVINVQFLTNHF